MRHSKVNTKNKDIMNSPRQSLSWSLATFYSFFPKNTHQHHCHQARGSLSVFQSSKTPS